MTMKAWWQRSEDSVYPGPGKLLQGSTDSMQQSILYLLVSLPIPQPCIHVYKRVALHPWGYDRRWWYRHWEMTGTPDAAVHEGYLRTWRQGVLVCRPFQSVLIQLKCLQNKLIKPQEMPTLKQFREKKRKWLIFEWVLVSKPPKQKVFINSPENYLSST